MPVLRALTPIFDKQKLIDQGSLVNTPSSTPPVTPPVFSLASITYPTLVVDPVTVLVPSASRIITCSTQRAYTADTSTTPWTPLGRLFWRDSGGTIRTGSAQASDGNIMVHAPSNPPGNPAEVLYVTDISDLSNPTIVGRVSATFPNSRCLTVAVSAAHNIVVGVGESRLKVFDISNPAAPTLLGTTSASTANFGATGTGVTGRGLAISANGNFAYYVNNTGTRFVVVNITNRAAPVVSGTIVNATNFGNNCFSCHVLSATRVVVSNLNRVSVCNVSVATAPTVLASVSNTNIGNNTSTLLGNYVYALNFITNNKLSTIDVTNPAAPVYIGSVSPKAAISGSQSLKQIASGFGNLVTAKYQGAQAETWDISTPSAPVVSVTEAAYSPGFTSPRNRSRLDSNTIVYGTVADTGIRRIQFANPSAPIRSTFIPPYAATSAVGGIAAIGTLVGTGSHLSRGNEVATLDYASPGSPSLLGAIVSNPGTSDIDMMVPLTNNHFLVNATNTDLVSAINVSTPASPTVSSTVSTASLGTPYADHGAASGTTGYFFRGSQIAVINAANPNAISLATTLSLPSPGASVVVIGNQLFVSMYSVTQSLRVYDITIPTAPSLVGDLPYAGGFDYMVAHPAGTHLFVLGYGPPPGYTPPRYVTLKVNAPGMPTIIGEHDVVGAPELLGVTAPATLIVGSTTDWGDISAFTVSNLS